MAQPTDASAPGQAISSVLAQMMQSEEYSDMSFSCNGELFKVHKAVVCPQSSVIQAAVQSGFKETENGTLNMDAFTTGSVRRFIQFMYTRDYDAVDIDSEEAQPPAKTNANADNAATAANDADSTENPPANTIDACQDKGAERPEFKDPVFRTMLAHTRMNAMGDYYDVSELVKLANTRVNATLSGASPDAPWVAGLPFVAEAALDIVNNEGLSDVLTTAVYENLGTILAVGTLEDSPLMTPFCLEVLKKCNATSQVLSETLSHRIRTLNEVNTKYQRAADQAVQQKKSLSILNTRHKCRNGSCAARFDCYFEVDGRLRCKVCHAKH